jgi:hypothetical protein
VGDSGIILTSPDGVNWTKRASGTTRCLRSVVFGADRFVAVGDETTILSSIDGLLWNGGSKNFVYEPGLKAVTYGKGIFVTVGNFYVFTSTDGVTWKDQYGPTIGLDDESTIVFGNGRFVIAGSVCLYSTDGVNWTYSHQYLFCVAYGNGTFVGARNEGMIYTSPDGVDWTVRYNKDPAAAFHGITFGAGRFVAVGYSGIIFTSVDGIAWTACHSGPTCNLNCIIYGLDRFVAVGDRGTIVTSPDGAVWELVSADTLSLVHIIFAQNRFIAVGKAGSIVTSTDGKAWTKQLSGTDQSFQYVTFGNGVFVVVGEQGAILTSPDAIEWTIRSSRKDTWLTAVAFGSSQFVAVGASGTILSSPDGADWTARTSPAMGGLDNLYSVAYGNGVFVAVGDNKYVSSDGVTWTHPVFFSGTLRKVTYLGNEFVALGVQETIAASPDGVNWKMKYHLKPSGEISCNAAFGNNRFVVGGAQGFITGAPDDSLWTRRYSELCSGIQSIAYGNRKFVGVGSGGIVLSCDDDKLGVRMQVRPKASNNQLRITGKGDGLLVQVPEALDGQSLFFEVISLAGKTVYRSALDSHRRISALRTGTFAKGTYLLRVSGSRSRIECARFHVF